MRVCYNGIDINVVETYEFSAEPVYDETMTDYLYTRYSIVVRGIINGQADIMRASPVLGTGPYLNGPVMSYRRGSNRVVPASDNTPPGGRFSSTPGFNNSSSVSGDRPNPFTAVPGGSTPSGPTGSVGLDLPSTLRLFTVTPAAVATNITHSSVRFRLTTPRGQLYIFAGPPAGAATVDMMVASPFVPSAGQASPPCDAKNGPIPKLFAVHQAFGDANTLLVDFAVETYINEGDDNGADIGNARSRGLVSNRFKQVNRITKDGYTRIETEGTAIFRTDILYQTNFNPDSIRSSLFMPVPLGFERENIVVSGISDVTGVKYVYEDVQQPVNFPAGAYSGAASISAVHRQAIRAGDLATGALQAYERFLGIKANKHFADSSKDKKEGKPTEPYSPPPGP